jgi:hypothetical protein
MSALIVGEQVRWQDLKVRSGLDIVFDIAKQEGWKDCEIFGSGAMITQPQESMGWKLIPADLYEDSIPPEAIARLHQIINAGVRVQGVIIADDERSVVPIPAAMPAPSKRKVSLPSVRPILTGIRKAFLGLLHLARAVVSLFGSALLGFIHAVEAVLSFSLKALLGLIRIVGVVALVWFFAYALIHFGVAVLLIGGFIALVAGAGSGTGSRISYDPKLIILVDDGEGGTTWISLFTWYD